ncbi:MAG: LysE family transporter [Peptococcaceae bacterium]|nr:LysE family transporter [Peptococcaceae bacterium]
MNLIYFTQGFVLGLAYVAPIGTQNMYVINAGLKEKPLKVLQVSLLTIFFDISLALACFWGVGALLDRFLFLKGLVLFLGSFAVIAIGIKLAIAPVGEIQAKPRQTSFLSVFFSCFAITWLNPQALIDGSLLLGGIYSTLPGQMVQYFILGTCSASFCWFLSLGGIVYFLRGYFRSSTLKIINLICGIIILIYGMKLGYSFIQYFLLA